MDPNATRAEAIRLANNILANMDAEVDDADATRLAELVLAMEEWIRKGGFLPREWQGKASKAKGGAD